MLEECLDSLTVMVDQTKANRHVLSQLCLLLWGIYGINLCLGRRLLYLGIMPRRLIGLPGIVFAPFLHLHFNHLFFNTIPLLVLANFILIQGFAYFMAVSIGIIVLSGALIWCFAKPGLYIGASAVITGYWGFLVSDVYQKGTVTAILLGMVCVYYFIGIFYSIFPGEKGVSWQGHLFGLVSGVVINHCFAVYF